ncbi:MAG: ATP-binding protein, partial [Patulibacter sp.]
PIVVLAELGGDGSAVYVRDEGPGFDPASVPPQRRGLRDSILTRMARVGGQATVESAPGEGTEIALRLPANDRGAR